MSSLALLIEHIVIEKFIRGDMPLAGKKRFERVISALSILFVFMGFGLLFFAAFLWLQAHYAPQTAAALTGALSLWIALMIGLVSLVIVRYKRSRVKQVRQEITESIYAALEVFEEELSTPIRENPKTAVLAASLAGFIAGERLI